MGRGYRNVSAILLLDKGMIIISSKITISLSLSIWSQYAMRPSTCCVPRNQQHISYRSLVIANFRPRDCTSLSSWNVRAPVGTICCVFTAPWFVQSWSTPAQCGTQVSVSRRRRHWSRCSAQSAEHHLWRRRLYDVVDSRWTRHAGVAVRTTDRALLQAQCAPRVVMSALSAAGQAWRLRHTQTAPRKNIWTCKTADG